jgi:putative membrane protein
VLLSYLRYYVGGFIMGSADLIPGVSGGTIALVLGIYERLVASIREGSLALGSLLKLDTTGFKMRLRQVEWGLLIPLLAGILTAVALLSVFIEHQLDEHPILLASAFFGLVLGSVWVAWHLVEKRHGRNVIIALLVGLVLFVVLGVGESAEVADPSLLVFFLSGALAICAMILPGISGSLILVLVGMYGAVLGAVTDRDLISVGVFVLGAIVGLALFSQILHWALARHRDLILAILVGLMAGSLRILWPWPDGVDSSAIAAPTSDLGWAILAAVIGAGFVLVIARLAGTREADQPVATVREAGSDSR